MNLDAARLHKAITTVRNRLMSERHPEGYWEGHLSSSALSTATAISALSSVNAPNDAARIQAGLSWLMQTQNPDGGWGDTPDSPGNLATTLLCLSALKLADNRGPTLERAQGYVTRHAGATSEDLARAVVKLYGKDRTFATPILMNCALAGLVRWPDVPPLPYALAALPHGFYRLLQLQVVSYALPALIAIGLVVDHRRGWPKHPLRAWRQNFIQRRVLRKLHDIQPPHGGFLEAVPLTSFVAMALVPVLGAEYPVVQRCLTFLRSAQRADGSWPIDSNLSVWLTTSAVSALAACNFTSPDHKGGGMASAISCRAASQAAEPSIDSHLSDRLRAGPTPHPHPASFACRPLPERERDINGTGEMPVLQWIIERQYQTVHPYTQAEPGGWGWTHLAGGVPDVDDTSGAIIAFTFLASPDRQGGGMASAISCRAASQAAEPSIDSYLSDRLRAGPTPHPHPARFARRPLPERERGKMGTGETPVLQETGRMPVLQNAARWLLSLQNSDGGWPTFCRGWGQLPFDQSAPDLTAHALRALHRAVQKGSAAKIVSALQRGMEYLHRVQRPDGAWLPLWFGNQRQSEHANPVLGTARVLRAFEELRIYDNSAQNGVNYLLSAQNPDGGWGGDCGVSSSVEETALAVTALAGWTEHPGVTATLERGGGYLVDVVECGGWDRPTPIGLYFARLWYSERLYPVIWTLEALGRLQCLGSLSNGG